MSVAWLRRAVWVLVALEILYLIAGNGFLWTELGRRTINRKPEKFAVTWESAWTWVPFWVHVRGLELSGHARQASWRVRADAARVHVWVPSLLARHVNLLDSNGRGVEVEIDLVEPEGPRPPREGKRSWRVSVSGGDLTAVERLRLDGLERGGLELSGRGTVRGRAGFQVRGPVDLRLARLRFEDARLTSGEATAASGLDLDAELEIGPFVLGEAGVGDVLATTSGEISLAAQTESLAFVNAYLSRAPWLEVGGAGHLTLNAGLADGWLEPGSTLTLTGSTVEARFAGLHAHGEGRVEGRVPPAASHVELAVTLERFAVDRDGDGATLVEGEALRLVASNDSNAIDRPAEGLALEVTLPPARVPDLATFSAYLPAAADVGLYGGGAELAAEVRFDSTTQQGDGRLTLAGQRVAARYRDLDLLFDLDLELELADTRLDRGSTGIAGSSLKVERATLAGASAETAGWWGRIEVAEGELRGRAAGEPGAPLALDARLEGRLRDSRPLVALLIEHKPKLGWFDGLLTVEDVTAGSRLRMEGRAMSLRQLAVEGGGKIELLAELDLPAPGERRGVFFARYRKLSAAVALGNGDRQWKLVGSRKWYGRQAAAYRAADGARVASDR